MANITPSTIFLSNVFKKLHAKMKNELDRPTINENKEFWIQGTATEVLKVILQRAKDYNSKNNIGIEEEDIMKLLDKVRSFYGFEIKLKN